MPAPVGQIDSNHLKSFDSSLAAYAEAQDPKAKQKALDALQGRVVEFKQDGVSLKALENYADTFLKKLNAESKAGAFRTLLEKHTGDKQLFVAAAVDRSTANRGVNRSADVKAKVDALADPGSADAELVPPTAAGVIGAMAKDNPELDKAFETLGANMKNALVNLDPKFADIPVGRDEVMNILLNDPSRGSREFRAALRSVPEAKSSEIRLHIQSEAKHIMTGADGDGIKKAADLHGIKVSSDGKTADFSASLATLKAEGEGEPLEISMDVLEKELEGFKLDISHAGFQKLPIEIQAQAKAGMPEALLIAKRVQNGEELHTRDIMPMVRLSQSPGEILNSIETEEFSRLGNSRSAITSLLTSKEQYRRESARCTSEIMAIIDSGMPIEMIIMLVMMKLNDRQEKKLLLKMKELAAAESLESAGLNAGELGLDIKGVQSLIQEVQFEQNKWKQMLEALAGVLRVIQDMAAVPIRNIR